MTEGAAHSAGATNPAPLPTMRRRWASRGIIAAVILLALGAGCVRWVHSTFVVPGRTFRAMHAAIRPGMTRLEALQTLAEVRGGARLWIGFIPDEDASDPVAWRMGERVSKADVESLDRKLAAAKAVRVIASFGFSNARFDLSVSSDGRVTTVGRSSGEAK